MIKKLNIKKLFLLQLFVIFAFALFAQTNSIHYTVKDGLPQMQCMSLFQDSKGFIWITTKGGVAKFNGVEFENYTVDDGLPTNSVQKIYEDKKGNILFVTAKGVCVFKNDSIILVKHNYGGLIRATNLHSAIDEEGTILMNWRKDNKFLGVLKFEKGEYSIIKSKFRNNKILSTRIFYEKKFNRFILNTFSTHNKFYTFKDNQLDTIIFKNWNDENRKLPVNQYLIRSDVFFMQKHDKKKNRADLYKLENEKIVLFNSFSGTTIRLVEQYDNNKFLIVLRDKNRYEVLSLENGRKFKIGSHYGKINGILVDSEKNIWIATEQGLHRISNFRNYNSKNSGMPNYVWAVVEDVNNRVWFASFGNEHLHFLQADTIVKHQKKQKYSEFYFGAITTSKGKTIFATSPGIITYDGVSFTPEQIGITLSVFEDTLENKIYYGTTSGLYIEDILGKKTLDHEFKVANKGNILSICQNKKGEIWYVTGRYIGTLNKEKNVELKIDSLPIYGSTVLFCDYKGNLWIGAQNGFYFYDYKKIVKIKHNELNTMIFSIAKIDSMRIVYGGSQGIGILDLEAFYKLDLSNKTEINAEEFVNYYDQSQGFLGEEVGQNGIFKDSKGRVWIPTNTNVVMFRPEDLKRNKREPQTYIAKFSSSNDNINWLSVNDTLIEFNYTQKNVSFEFIGISHTAPSLVKYKYRLLGFSDEWSKPTKERQTNFTNLESGNYRFELLAANSNGVWNKKAIIREFEIIPAWWQTNLAKIGFVIVILVFIYLSVLFLWKRKQKRLELASEMTDLQYKAVRSQLYPHFLFNSISAIGSFLFQAKPEIAYKYFAKLSKLIRTVLDDSKKSYKSLEEEIEFVSNYLELQKMRFEERFDYEIRIDEKVNPAMEIPQMIIQTYVENAIKHGLEPLKKGGLLKISIEKQNGNTLFVIEDNGIGIEKSKELKTIGTKSGLKIMNTIFDIHNERYASKISFEMIDLYKEAKKGTRIELKLTENGN